MSKYVIAKTGEPVKIGDIISLKREKKTSNGVFKYVYEYTITEDNIDTLISKGIIKQVGESSPKKYKSIEYYVDKLGNRFNISAENVGFMLDKWNKVCPKAVLDILLQEIALDFYKSQIYDRGKVYYSLRPKDGKVGVLKTPIPFIPLFTSKEDAEKAREILNGQLTLMYGEQKN